MAVAIYILKDVKDFLTKKNLLQFFLLVVSVVGYNVCKMKINKEKRRYGLQFCFNKDENTSQTAEIINDLYSLNTRSLMSSMTGIFEGKVVFVALPRS